MIQSDQEDGEQVQNERKEKAEDSGHFLLLQLVARNACLQETLPPRKESLMNDSWAAPFLWVPLIGFLTGLESLLLLVTPPFGNVRAACL